MWLRVASLIVACLVDTSRGAVKLPRTTAAWFPQDDRRLRIHEADKAGRYSDMLEYSMDLIRSGVELDERDVDAFLTAVNEVMEPLASACEDAMGILEEAQSELLAMNDECDSPPYLSLEWLREMSCLDENRVDSLGCDRATRENENPQKLNFRSRSEMRLERQEAMHSPLGCHRSGDPRDLGNSETSQEDCCRDQDCCGEDDYLKEYCQNDTQSNEDTQSNDDAESTNSYRDGVVAEVQAAAKTLHKRRIELHTRAMSVIQFIDLNLLTKSNETPHSSATVRKHRLLTRPGVFRDGSPLPAARRVEENAPATSDPLAEAHYVAADYIGENGSADLQHEGGCEGAESNSLEFKEFDAIWYFIKAGLFRDMGSFDLVSYSDAFGSSPDFHDSSDPNRLEQLCSPLYEDFPSKGIDFALESENAYFLASQAASANYGWLYPMRLQIEVERATFAAQVLGDYPESRRILEEAHKHILNALRNESTGLCDYETGLLDAQAEPMDSRTAREGSIAFNPEDSNIDDDLFADLTGVSGLHSVLSLRNIHDLSALEPRNDKAGPIETNLNKRSHEKKFQGSREAIRDGLDQLWRILYSEPWSRL